MDKIIFLERLVSIVGKKKVLVGGCFDVLHVGHVRFLSTAKKQGEFLYVALESDEFIIQKKNRTPFHTQLERAEVLSALSSVDCVIVLPFMKTDNDYVRLIEAVKPDVIAFSEGDTHEEKKRQQAVQIGARIHVAPFIKGKSSTVILDSSNKKIQTGEL